MWKKILLILKRKMRPVVCNNGYKIWKIYCKFIQFRCSPLILVEKKEMKSLSPIFVSEPAKNPTAISSRKERASSSSPSNGVLPPKRHPSSVSADTSGVSSPSVQAEQNLSEEDQVRYAMLISEANQRVEEKNIPQALYLNKQALKILPSEKLQRKIQRMQVLFLTGFVVEVVIARLK